MSETFALPLPLCSRGLRLSEGSRGRNKKKSHSSASKSAFEGKNVRSDPCANVGRKTAKRLRERCLGFSSFESRFFSRFLPMRRWIFFLHYELGTIFFLKSEQRYLDGMFRLKIFSNESNPKNDILTNDSVTFISLEF